MTEFAIHYLNDAGENKIDIHYFGGDAFFSLIDILSILNHKSPIDSSFVKSIVKNLDKDEYYQFEESVYVNQPGLLRIFSLDESSDSKKLRRWLYHEVIPSLIKYGTYPSEIKFSNTVLIDTNRGPISLRELNRFLTTLNALYTLAVTELGCSTTSIIVNQQELKQANELAKKMRKILSKTSENQLAAYSLIQLPYEQELTFTNIRRRNPLDIVFSGVSIALVVALIISGGKFELGLTKLKIELPPLGEGIAKIKKGLSKETPKK
ncbi:hypothetical protein OE749_07255 [Aestuariibacter sp. AA17]|uniref:Bro-N domain-containing protein n=1 Tax=Fluctibacter corallii TaxID=2984329 RepID=A0ABT3A738_9ALTE|nr:hypothetical protein [Aestuariibacter sp. AA17]MCV2884486.1 hypothetical protein [Aestuariibacter sp. AA17]